MEKQITPIIGLLILLGFLAFTLQSCLSPRDKSIKEWEAHEWQLVKADKSEEPSWKIYKRKLKGTDFLAFKIEGDVQSTPTACLTAFKQDIYSLAAGADRKTYPIYEILNDSEGSFLTYVIHKEPFPFKNTEMITRYMFTSDEGGNSYVTWKEAWEESKVAPTKKLKRVESFRGSWSFSPTTSYASQVINSVHFDPKGMPLWLVTPMVSKFLKEGLEAIRKTAE